MDLRPFISRSEGLKELRLVEGADHPDKKAKGDLTCSKAIILACRPYWWKKDFPRVNRASDELRAITLEKWPDLFPDK